ncbi:hypothetical protein COEREDRAFT_89036 [Coemansia reversa NRRL 1564]|uniref:Uncharacterized protein n=1 Tax=Coemansia reversa (strain ATCC 12441 / NRRL 1564) TaxID=763665 RepID=A0A2G5B4Z9_COERN|nr:hypothetical protein COEREDRAFT_89036 [Coemansia reversa NRRL 1564]|eukprot:PIA14084.1 hypothetical protein COEREDRAFT_89036 [Coemansia reversa NRRL 1564]
MVLSLKLFDIFENQDVDTFSCDGIPKELEDLKFEQKLEEKFADLKRYAPKNFIADKESFVENDSNEQRISVIRTLPWEPTAFYITSNRERMHTMANIRVKNRFLDFANQVKEDLEDFCYNCIDHKTTAETYKENSLVFLRKWTGH